MKKLAMLTALVTLIGSLGVTAPVSAEETIGVGTELGAGWTITSVGENTVFEEGKTWAYITDKQAHSGSNSLYFRGDTSNDKFTIEHPASGTNRFNSTDWNPNTDNQWTVSFWMKAESDEWLTESANDKNARYNMKIGTLNSAGSTTASCQRKLIWENVEWGETDANGWTKGSFDFIYPYSDANGSFKIMILGSTFGTYIDDIEVKYSGTKDGLKDRNISLLSGGDFEYLTETGEDIASYGWTTKAHTSFTNPPSVDIVQDETGNKMMRVKFTEFQNVDQAFFLHKALSHPKVSIAWEPFMLSFKMKGTYHPSYIQVGNMDYTHIVYLDNGRQNSYKEYATVTPLEDGWVQYDCKIGGQIEDSTVDFRFDYNKFYEIYIDDVCVRKLQDDETDSTIVTATYPDAQIFNGSFDADTETKISPKNWVPYVHNGQSGDLVTRSTKFAYSGENSLYIAAPNSYVDERYVQFSQSMPADFDYSKDYTLKLKMKTLSPETTLHAFFGVNGNVECSERALLSSETTGRSDGYAATNVEALGDGWYEYTTTLTALEGTSPEKISFLAMSGLDATWIDDVSLTDENGKEYIVNGSFEEFNKYEVGGSYIVLDELDTVPAPQVGENTLYVPITTNEAGLDYYVYFAIYKGGQLYKVQKAEYLDAAVGTKEVDATITIENDANYSGKYTAKAFVWDSAMKAYSNAADFIEAE